MEFRRGRRPLQTIASVLVLVFGLASIHYTTVPKAEHHREWALAHDMPEPNFTIFVVGAIATVMGAGMFGFLIGSRARKA